MREEALDSAASVLSKSFDGNCDALLEEDELLEIFGERYYKHPENFKFLPGQIAFIKTLAAHVKKLVEDGGLQQFNEKRKKRKNTNLARALNCIPNKRGICTTEKSSSVNPSHSQLANDLFNKVIICLKSYAVDVNNFSENFIKVDPSGTYGEITCILCQDENQKPKRVYYHSRTHSRSSYWVLSNFNKHLEKHHFLVAHRSNEKKSIQQHGLASELELEAQLDCNGTLADGQSQQEKLISEHKSNENNENEKNREPINDVELLSNGNSNNISKQLLDASVELVGVSSPIDVNSLFTQMSEQIQQMIAATLVNGDKQENMQFHFRKAAHTLSVVSTEANGNCLFSAIAHQLWPNGISSSQHKRNTKGLRKTVVEHILKPENFEKYERILEERVEQIGATEKDTKMFVRLVLARSGQWGGLETIKAVSNEYKVNVVVFNESGMCNMIQGLNDKHYTRTIMIAYRLGTDANGESIYNHYDSVTDMNSQSILKAAELITFK